MPRASRGVRGSENRCVLRQPFGESSLSRWRLLRDEQIRHQAFDFFASEDHVADDWVDEAQDPERNGWPEMDEQRLTADAGCNQADKILESENFRADGIEYQI